VPDELLDITHMCKLIDAANPAKARGPYKKREAEAYRTRQRFGTSALKRKLISVVELANGAGASCSAAIIASSST